MTTPPDGKRAEGVRPTSTAALEELMYASLRCLYIAVDESVARDVTRNVNQYVERLTAENAALRKQARDHEECIGELEYAQENAALRAAQPDVETWRSIESAPKDGSEVLLLVKRRAGIAGKCLVGHYQTERRGEGWDCCEAFCYLAPWSRLRFS